MGQLEVKMQIIENLKVKEKVYIDKLENGLTVMIIPKKNILYGGRTMGQMIVLLLSQERVK